MVDAWLATDNTLRASVIHERLVADHGFAGSYQRVKLYVAEARPRIAAELGLPGPLTGLHRRFEVTPGAQAQVDWGTESRSIAKALGVRYVYSFHMTLSYSRNPFCCFTTSLDLATFFGCHLRGVRALRWGAGQHRLRPDQDRGAPARRTGAGSVAIQQR